MTLGNSDSMRKYISLCMTYGMAAEFFDSAVIFMFIRNRVENFLTINDKIKRIVYF